jgi:SAM-dependent methyltransferase
MDLRELPINAFHRHPWEIVRADFFTHILRDEVQGDALSVLDIGSGDGFLARRLLTAWPAVAHMTCFDPAYTDRWIVEQTGSQRGLSFTAKRPEGRFDLILLLDVLEHAVDGRSILHDAASSFLEPGGSMLLSVPAHPLLYSHHDALLGHERRYTPGELRSLVSGLGLTILTQGELFGSLLLPRVVEKLAGLLFPKPPPSTTAPPSQIETALGTWRGGPLLSAVTKAMLTIDAACCRAASQWRLPSVGLSTWVLARGR